jgi:DNA polymerase III alpha subunit
MFIHLHTHSYYSFLEALPSPAELALAASQAGMRALALADHQVLTGAIEFYDACRGLGVQPLLGLELDIAHPAGAPSPAERMVFLAMDIEGWRSLCRLSSAAREFGQSRPFHPYPPAAIGGGECRADLSNRRKARSLNELLREGREKAAAAFLGRLAELFPGRLYVELQFPTGRTRYG